MENTKKDPATAGGGDMEISGKNEPSSGSDLYQT